MRGFSSILQELGSPRFVVCGFRSYSSHEIARQQLGILQQRCGRYLLSSDSLNCHRASLQATAVTVRNHWST